MWKMCSCDDVVIIFWGIAFLACEEMVYHYETSQFDLGIVNTLWIFDIVDHLYVKTSHRELLRWYVFEYE